jgi:2-polyprenyl-3-methyl-5-hydroxy-6-metoxy-1,4-benzoquinol methylase
MTTTTEQPTTGAAIEALAGRLFESAVGALELCNIHLGARLGLYGQLAQSGPLTAAALADRLGLDRRYVQEWLQAQAVSGFVTIDGTDLTTAAFTLAPGVAPVLLDELSPAYLAPLATMLASVGAVLPDLADAFRTGAGVPYAAYPGAVQAQAALNRPAYATDLVGQWLPAVPDIAARLADPDAQLRVADLGCGAGWAAISLAEAFPHLRIDGYDADEESIALARRHAADRGVADRVRFEVCDLSEPDDTIPRYDLALMFECLHDFGYPQRILTVTHCQLAAGGTVIVLEEHTDDELVAPTSDPVQRLFANVSPVWCLPQGRMEPDAEPVGTVIRPDRLRQLAADAGFHHADVLPIEHPFFRFYRLTA